MTISYVRLFGKADFERRLSTFFENEVDTTHSFLFPDDFSFAAIFLELVLYDEVVHKL